MVNEITWNKKSSILIDDYICPFFDEKIILKT